MELAFLVWGISMLKGISAIFIAISAVSGISCFFWWLYGAFEYDEKVKWRLVLGLFSAAFAAFIAVLIPSEKTAYIMVGAYATQQLVEAPGTQIIGKKVLTIIEQKLDSYIVEKAEQK
jgi:hypothetical protein